MLLYACSSSTRVSVTNLNCNFPLPHVFPPPPFPLEREPTASAPRGDTLGTRIDRDISLIMPPSFVRRLRNNMAQSDGTTVKLGARYGRRLATPIPSSNRHMPCIRTLRINQNLRNCTKCNITHSLHAYHCPQDNITVPLGTISLACRCGSITKSPFAPALCIAESQKGFTFSFYYFVCSWSILSMTRSTTSNPSPTVSAEKRSGTS